MRRLALIAPALLVPLLPAAPAFAVGHVICVDGAVGSCDETVVTIAQAITAANGNSVDDTILLGAQTYSVTPFQLDGATHGVTLQGAGAAATTVTVPASTSHDT